jgi:putative ABC transport system permease protein
MFEMLLQDLRYAARGLIRSPGFALTAIATAAIGIGAATAVFSVVDRILFRSLPYPAADRLVSVGMLAPLDTNEFIMPDAYFMWQKTEQPFESMTSFIAGGAECDVSGEPPARLGCLSVESNFLSTLGLSMAAGRFFTAEEDVPNAPGVSVITHALWQTRFGADPSVIGRALSIDGRSTTIVGVLPAAFEMPTH